jgi:phosphate transport system substrate-binding protein
MKLRASGRLLGFVCLLVIVLAGCSRKGQKSTIQNSGSDTIVNLAQAWAEEYATVEPSVSVEVSGGGSGTGIAALIAGDVDIANCSRKMEPEEFEQARKNTHKEPKEYLVGFDGLAVYVSKNNPLEEISLEQLAEIYGENGKITKWSQLGVKLPPEQDDIIRISRQSNSGTFVYFREAVLGKTRDFKMGTRDMHGSKDVVEIVAQTPAAIGYSGMGYATPEVKMLRLAKKSGDKAIAPTPENVLNHTYPIARPLLMYTLGEPTGAVKKYMDWIHSEMGQKIVVQTGYVPLPADGSKIQ